MKWTILDESDLVTVFIFGSRVLNHIDSDFLYIDKIRSFYHVIVINAARAISFPPSIGGTVITQKVETAWVPIVLRYNWTANFWKVSGAVWSKFTISFSCLGENILKKGLTCTRAAPWRGYISHYHSPLDFRSHLSLVHIHLPHHQLEFNIILSN